MRKLGPKAIQTIIEQARKEFLADDSAPRVVRFLYKGHRVNAVFEWSFLCSSWYLYCFDIVYSGSVMRYKVNVDYDKSSACCW